MMAHKFDTSKDILAGLKQDMLWLLIVIYSYLRRSRMEGFSQLAREDVAVEGVLLESAMRDIVSRLTALDDDTKNNRSFQTLFTAMKREGLDPDRSRELGSKVRAFRQAINDLKVSHRNSYIAHVGTTAEVKPRAIDEPVSFAEPASYAVNLLDNFKGEQIQYYFRTGSDQTIDLRKALQAQ